MYTIGLLWRRRRCAALPNSTRLNGSLIYPHEASRSIHVPTYAAKAPDRHHTRHLDRFIRSPDGWALNCDGDPVGRDYDIARRMLSLILDSFTGYLDG